MKRGVRILMLVAIGVLALAFGILAGRWCGGACRMPARDALPGLYDEAQLAKELHLTPDQTVVVRALVGEYRQTLSGLCAEHCTLRAQMADLLPPTGTDSARLQDLVEKMGQTQVKSDLATLEHMRKVGAQLTPAQMVTFKAWVVPSVGGNCPTGLHLCDPK